MMRERWKKVLLWNKNELILGLLTRWHMKHPVNIIASRRHKNSNMRIELPWLQMTQMQDVFWRRAARIDAKVNREE